MSPSPNERFEQIVAEIVQAEESGHAPDVARYLERFPDLAGPLREFFRDRSEFNRRAPLLAPALPEATPDAEPHGSRTGSIDSDSSLEEKPTRIFDKPLPFAVPLGQVSNAVMSAETVPLSPSLDRVRADGPVPASPAHQLASAVKGAKRRLALAALLGVLVGALATLVTLGTWFTGKLELAENNARGQEQKARQEAGKAKQARDFLVSLLRISDRDIQGGNLNLWQFVADTEKRIALQFAEQPELRAELLAAIEDVKRRLGRRFPAVMRTGRWVIEGTELVQQAILPEALLLFGDAAWTDYDVEVEGQITQGSELGVVVRATGFQDMTVAVLGGWKNKFHSLLPKVAGRFGVSAGTAGKTIPGVWYRIKVVVRGKTATLLLAGREVAALGNLTTEQGLVGLRTIESSARFRNIRVLSPTGKALSQGLPSLPVGKEAAGVR